MDLTPAPAAAFPDRATWAAQAEHHVRTTCYPHQRVSPNPDTWLTPEELAEAHTAAAELVKATRRALNALVRAAGGTATRSVQDIRFSVSGASREATDPSADVDELRFAWERLIRYAREHGGPAAAATADRLTALTTRMRTARDTAGEEALQAAIAREVARRNSDEGWQQELDRRASIRRGPQVTTYTVRADGFTEATGPVPYRPRG